MQTQTGTAWTVRGFGSTVGELHEALKTLEVTPIVTTAFRESAMHHLLLRRQPEDLTDLQLTGEALTHKDVQRILQCQVGPPRFVVRETQDSVMDERPESLRDKIASDVSDLEKLVVRLGDYESLELLARQTGEIRIQLRRFAEVLRAKARELAREKRG